MDPKKLVEDEDKPKKIDKILHATLTQYDESLSIRSTLEHRWAKNQKLIKGIPLNKERITSTVRKRNKIRFRKIWSNAMRLLASLYQAFLIDKNKFKVRGFDDLEDWKQAKVLDIMTKYRLNWLFRRKDGFVKFIWAFLDCISPGSSVVKIHWKFNEDLDIDEPTITNYPLEQVALDWTASTVSDMRYAYLENYLTEDQLEEMGYENINKAQPIDIPVSLLRETRFHETGDPMRSRNISSGINYQTGTVGSNYPDAGSPESGDTMKDHLIKRYLAVECWYKKEGKLWFGVFNPQARVWFVNPMVSPYGTIYPIAVGSMLLEAHKLIPESVIEPLEGPQEDLNMTLNLRKDNQMLAMMGGWSVDKFGGVDKQALSNLRPGFIVSRNSGQGLIEPLRLPDVTQSSYIEANADQVMIDEMSGITPTKQGQADTDKTGVAQINLMESNAKERLYTAIVGETLFRQVIYLLAYQIQLFETDERIFRVANNQLRKENVEIDKRDNVYNLEFDMDVEIDVGTSEISRAVEIQRKFAFTDRALQSNQSTILLLKSGIQVKDPTVIDTGKILSDIAESLEIDNFQDYKISVGPPPAPAQPGGREAQAAEGQVAPQPNQQGEASADFLQSLQQGLQQ